MNLIYTVCVIIAFGSMVIMRKKPTLLFVYLLSSILYYINAFFGEIYVGSLSGFSIISYDITDSTYIALLINIVLVVFAICNEDNGIPYIAKVPIVKEEKVMKLFMFAVFILSIYMCLKYNVFIRIEYNKTELAEQTGGMGTYYKYLSSFAFVYIHSCSNMLYSKKWKVIGTFPILSTFMFGNRSFLIVSILALVLYHVIKSCSYYGLSAMDYARKYKKVVFSLLVLIAVTFIVKGVTGALFIGDKNLVASRLTDREFYERIIHFSEPNTIMRNLDSIISSDYQVSKSSYISLWAYFIPFATETIENAMGVQSFTQAYQKVVYASEGVSNRASTYIGESYANGGFLMTFIVISFYLIFLSYIYKKICRCRNNISCTTFLLIGVDAAFYVQRNSMTFEFGRFRSYIYICLIVYALAYLLKGGNHNSIFHHK